VQANYEALDSFNPPPKLGYWTMVCKELILARIDADLVHFKLALERPRYLDQFHMYTSSYLDL